MAVGLTATAQSVWPTRVQLALTGVAVSDSVVLYRVVSGERTAIRAGTLVATDTSVVVVDSELPFGVVVSYLATVNGVEYSTSSVTYTLAGGKVALTDAISGLSAEVVILGIEDRDYDTRASLFNVGGKNIVVSDGVTQATSDIELYIPTTQAGRDLMAILAGATGGVIQIRQPGGYDGIDSYISILGVRERRWSVDGSDPRRRYVLRAVDVDSWPASLEARGYTLADLDSHYTGLTLADLAGDYSTLLDIALAEFP